MAEIKTYQQYIDEVCNCGLPWGDLQNCNILITGATGLIGSTLVDVLMQKHINGLHIYAAGRNEDRAKKRFRRYLNCDHFHLFRYDVTKSLECDVNFHYIIHAASNASPNFFKQNPVEVMKANLFGTTNLIEYGLQHAMKRMLYVSTGEIYGEGDGRIFTEDYSGYVDCTQPRSCYPSSKRAAETLCASYIAEYHTDIVIARPGHVFGPHFTESDNRVYSQFIRNILNGEDIVLKSKGEAFRSWTFVVDCASALLYILLKGHKGEAYNIADDRSNITIRELAELIAEIGHRRVVFNIPDDGKKGNTNPITKSVFSTEKLRNLGWNIQGNLKEYLQATIDECKRND
jgi:nucleoside-diphosphate-sugar epimerase